MLDQSVPYVGFFMKRPAGTAFTPVKLADGFSFALYKHGNETDWARIETSVGEFESEFKAMLYFKHYFKSKNELERRCVFIEDENSKKVATATAWWHFVEQERRPWLHWVAVDPAYQGLGLGKAITSEVTRIMLDLEGDTDFYLHTQTWSHKATGIYKKFGYFITDEKILYNGNKENNYKKAIRILENLQRP